MEIKDLQELQELLQVVLDTHEVWFEMARGDCTGKPEWAEEKYEEGCPFCEKYFSIKNGCNTCPIGPIVRVSKPAGCRSGQGIASYYDKWMESFAPRKTRSACWMMVNGMAQAAWNIRIQLDQENINGN